MLTSVNSTNETNKEDSNFSRETQALASTPPEEAGILQADEAPTPALASTAPADSSHRTRAAAKTPEMPPKIDAVVYADQTGQSLPQCQTTAHTPTTEHTLVRVLDNSKPENCPGVVFTPGMTDPAESLYQMFINIQGKMVPDPDKMTSSSPCPTCSRRMKSP